MATPACISCGKNSSFFCLCTASKPTYCLDCISGHITAGGAHLTSSVASERMVKHPTDLYRYNVRLQVVDSLTRSLTTLSHKLDLEQTTATSTLKAIETDQVSALKSAFSRIRSDLTALFQSLQTSISRVKSELVACENDPGLSFTKETHLFLGSAMHLPDVPFECVNIPVEVARRVMLSFSAQPIDSAKAFEGLMRSRRCRATDCNRCEGLREGLEVWDRITITEYEDESRMFATYISELPTKIGSDEGGVEGRGKKGVETVDQLLL